MKNILRIALIIIAIAMLSTTAFAATTSTTQSNGQPFNELWAALNQTNISVSAEKAARIGNDTLLQNNINAEAAARTAADATLQSNIDTKEPIILSGLISQYWRGDKTWQTLDTLAVPENTNLYWTQGRFDTALAGKTTDNLVEGALNLYFTDIRAKTAIDTAYPLLDTNKTDDFTNANEIDPIFTASPAFTISGTQITNWDATIIGLASEITDRTNADNTLQSNIDTETTARETADTALDTRVGVLEAIDTSAWDKNAADDFSGNYNDLTNKPSFTGWDTNVADDFSGAYADLAGKPDFSAWDQNAADDFSGAYSSLTGAPTALSQFTDDIGVAADYDQCSDVDGCGYLKSYTETDPQVGTLTSGKWCNSDGTTVNCNQDVPQGPKGDKGDTGATGATGATGSDGAAGAKGDKGDTGPAGTNGVSGWERVSASSANNSDVSKSVTVTCSGSGSKKVLGGGANTVYNTGGGGTGKEALVKTYPSADNAWTAEAVEVSGDSSSWQLTVYAICATVN